MVAPIYRAHHAENTAHPAGLAWAPAFRALGGLVLGAAELHPRPSAHLPQTSTCRNSQQPGFCPAAPDRDDPRRRNEGQWPPDVAPSEASSAGAAELAFFHESRQSTTATERSEHDDGCHRQWRERVGSAPSDAVTLAGATMEIATPRTPSRRPGQTML